MSHSQAHQVSSPELWQPTPVYTQYPPTGHRPGQLSTISIDGEVAATLPILSAPKTSPSERNLTRTPSPSPSEVEFLGQRGLSQRPKLREWRKWLHREYFRKSGMLMNRPTNFVDIYPI